MVYKNNTLDAVMAMERARTGNYGEDEYDTSPECCEVCGDYYDEMYEYNGKTYMCLRCLQEACMEAMSNEWRKL